MQRLEVSGAVRLIYGSLGVKRLRRIEQDVIKNVSLSSCKVTFIFVKF